MNDSTTQIFHIANDRSLVQRVSSYVEPTSEEIRGHVQSYDDRAIIPKINAADPGFRTMAFDDKSYRNGRDVVVGNYANFDIKKLKKIHKVLDNLCSLESLTSNDSYQTILMQFSELVSEIASGEAGVEILGVLLSPPNFYTTTFDFNKKCYLGLHIDDWDGNNHGERHLGRQRIILNIASEPRVFLFSECSVDEMQLDWVSGKAPTDLLHDAGITKVGQMLYVVIPPNGFCIAPTENVIHDGSTLHNSKPAIALTALFHTNGQQLSKLSALD